MFWVVVVLSCLLLPDDEEEDLHAVFHGGVSCDELMSLCAFSGDVASSAVSVGLSVHRLTRMATRLTVLPASTGLTLGSGHVL